MLYHILHWNYMEGLPEAERARIEAELEALPARVPTLKALWWGPVVGGRNQSFSHSFVMLFEDAAALNEYAAHPDHASFAAMFRAACSTQVVVDIEVQDEPIVA